jgi:non-homologous end joining protein Ku
LHYPEQVRVCPQTIVPLAPEPTEELRLAGLLIDAASGQVDWRAYPDQAAQELKALLEAKLAGQAEDTTTPARTLLPLLQALQQSLAVPSGSGDAAPLPEKKSTRAPVPEKTPRKRARRTA